MNCEYLGRPRARSNGHERRRGIDRESRSQRERLGSRPHSEKGSPTGGTFIADRGEGARHGRQSLGRQHLAHAVALQNLGLYYDFIENDTPKATEFFNEACTVLKENDLPLAYGFFKLGVFHYEANHDARRVEAALMQALAIQRRGLASDELELAETLVALAYAKVRMSEVDAAVPLMEEALRIQRVRLGSTDRVVIHTEERLALLRRVAYAPPQDDGRGPTGSGAPDVDKPLEN